MSLKSIIAYSHHFIAHCWSWMLYFWITGFHRATSASSTARNSAGELATTSIDCVCSFSRTAGSASILTISS